VADGWRKGSRAVPRRLGEPGGFVEDQRDGAGAGGRGWRPTTAAARGEAVERQREERLPSPSSPGCCATAGGGTGLRSAQRGKGAGAPPFQAPAPCGEGYGKPKRVPRSPRPGPRSGPARSPDKAEPVRARKESLERRPSGRHEAMGGRNRPWT
jgi:hypothetical protein